jgi:hypothetical protein
MMGRSPRIVRWEGAHRLWFSAERPQSTPDAITGRAATPGARQDGQRQSLTAATRSASRCERPAAPMFCASAVAPPQPLARPITQTRLSSVSAYCTGMWRSKRARLRTLDVPLPARNRALHYLAHEDRLSDDLRRQLTEVVNGYVGRCNEAAARAGIEWMRERYRAVGQTPRF